MEHDLQKIHSLPHEQHGIATVIDNSSTEIAKQYDLGLIDYECQRQSLWDIHQFVEKVLATTQPGFLITTDRKGRLTVIELSLARYYRLIRNYIDRIPFDGCSYNFVKVSRYIKLFLECCIEKELIFDSFTGPGDRHRSDMNGAELYNSLLDLIRFKARTIPRYINAVRYASNYDVRLFSSIKKYVDGLFLLYSKLLVVRLDVEYREEYAKSMTYAQAQRDIRRFISNRRWNRAFKHSVGYVIAREYGKQGAGYHFHCFVFYNGQKQNKDYLLAKAVGTHYWSNRVTRIAQSDNEILTRGKYFNCSAKREEYRHSGIGMITHSDEVKRAELLYALMYLTKNDQKLPSDAPLKAKTVTKGMLPRITGKRRGPRRKVVGGSEVSSSNNCSLQTNC